MGGSTQEAWNAGWDAASEGKLRAAPTGALVDELTRRTGHRPMLVDDLAEVLAEAPLEFLVDAVRRRTEGVPRGTSCVALGGSRSTVCGRPVDESREGDLCAVHQDEATAIGRDLVSLLTRLRWTRDG